MGCFVSAAPTSIFMGGFTKTTENLNQRGSFSTIRTQDSLTTMHHTTSRKSGGENLLYCGVYVRCLQCVLCLSWLPYN